VASGGIMTSWANSGALESKGVLNSIFDATNFNGENCIRINFVLDNSNLDLGNIGH